MGRIHLFGDNIDTDVIIPARYLNTSDPAELAKHCMVDVDAKFVERVLEGDILVAGRNFGCGSSREHAPIAIKAAGVSCVVAESFARIFLRNAINVGLPVVELKTSHMGLETGQDMQIDFEQGRITVAGTGQTAGFKAFPPFINGIIKAGGLMAYHSTTEDSRRHCK